MTINPSTDRGSTGRWKYGWVPPTPQQLCDMLKNIPFNGNTVSPGSTLVIGYNDPDCPEFMNVEKDIYVTDMIGTEWDDTTNTITWVLNLSNGNQVSILGATTGDGGVNLATLWITSIGAYIGPKSLVSLKAKAMSVLSLKSESELKAEEKK